MRRFAASALLILFSFMLMGDTVLAASEAQVPACCRRDGKHHCQMTGFVSNSAGAAFQANRPRCGEYPLGVTVAPHGTAAVVSGPTAFGPAPVDASVPGALGQHTDRASIARSCYKRGPPQAS